MNIENIKKLGDDAHRLVLAAYRGELGGNYQHPPFEQKATSFKLWESRLREQERLLQERETGLKSREQSLLERQRGLQWVDRPFLYLYNKVERRWVGGLAIDPKIHSFFTPIVKVEVKLPKLVGSILPIQFHVYRESRKRPLFEAAVNHELSLGINAILSEEVVSTENLVRDRYRVFISLAESTGLNTFTFGLEPVEIPARLGPEGVLKEYDRINNPGLTVQGVIDLIEDLNDKH